jgi:hypothetical protein
MGSSARRPAPHDGNVPALWQKARSRRPDARCPLGRRYLEASIRAARSSVSALLMSCKRRRAVVTRGPQPRRDMPGSLCLLPILLPSRQTMGDRCRQIWNIGPAPDRRRTVLDSLPTPTDQKGTQFQGGAAAPDPAAYGLSPPLFQPLTAYPARGRIFPAPAQGNRTPAGSPVRAPRWSPAEVFSWHQRGEGKRERPRRCRPRADSTRAGVRSKAHRFAVAGRAGCTGSRSVVVTAGHQGGGHVPRAVLVPKGGEDHGHCAAPGRRGLARHAAGSSLHQRGGPRTPVIVVQLACN